MALWEGLAALAIGLVLIGIGALFLSARLQKRSERQPSRKRRR